MSAHPPRSGSSRHDAPTAVWIPVAIVALLAVSIVPAAEGTARVTGEVTDDDGEPVAGVRIVFDPIDQSAQVDPLATGDDGKRAPRGQKVEAETNKKGKFAIGNFPVGTYQARLDHEELAVRSMRFVGRAPDGEKVGDFAGDAGISGRSPAFTLVTGLRAKLEISVGEKPDLPSVSDIARARDTSPVLRELNDLFAQQSWSELATRAGEVVAESPDLGGAHYLQGVAQWRTGDHGAAVATLRKAVQLVPDQPGIHGTLGSLLIEHGEKLAAEERADEAAAAYLEASEELAKQLETTPDNVSYLTNRVIALDRSGRADDTLAALDALIAADPTQIRAYLHKAEVLTDSGRPDEAMAVIGEIPEGGPPAAAAVYNAAVELYNAGNMEATIAATDKAWSMDDTNPLFLQLKGRALIKLGQDAEGIEVLRQYLTMVPEDDPEAETDRALVQALGGGN